MAWDADKPAGNQKIRLSDEEIRANNAALEDALAREHTFPGVEGDTAGEHRLGDTTQTGFLQLATVGEAQAGTDETKAVTPKGMVSSLGFACPGFFSRLKVHNNAAVPASKLDISADVMVITDADGNPFVAKPVSLTINGATTGANALDTGTLTNDTWYYAFVIAKADGTVAGLLSASKTSPSLPTDYIYKKLVSAVYYTGDAFFNFKQYNREIEYLNCGITEESLPPYITFNSVNWALLDITAVIPDIAVKLWGDITYNISQSGLRLAWDNSGLINYRQYYVPLSATADRSHFYYSLNPDAPQTVYAKTLAAVHLVFAGFELDI